MHWLCLALDETLMWSPFMLGMSIAGMTAYYGNHFVSTDIDAVHGTWTGTSGSATMGLSGAALGVNSLAVLVWFKYLAKWKNNHITKPPGAYNRWKVYFWILMLFFFLLTIVLCSLNIVAVDQFLSQDITVNTSSGVIGGAYGNAMLGIDYTTLALGAISFIVFLIAEFHKRTDETRRMTIQETLVV